MAIVTKRRKLKSDANMKPKTQYPPTSKKYDSPDFQEYTAYQLAIERLALKSDPTEFSNKGPIHASIVFGNIFKTAKEEIKIFTGSFSGEISDQEYYRDNLKLFLKKNIPLTIIFQNAPNKNSLALSLFKEYPQNNISLWALNDHREVFVNHFATADGKMFRIETSPTDFEAQCSFNDPKTSEALDYIFSRLLTHSAPYPNI